MHGGHITSITVWVIHLSFFWSNIYSRQQGYICQHERVVSRVSAWNANINNSRR